jgi:chromosomal replication initiator protein
VPSPPAVGFEHRLADAIARRISQPRYNLWFRDHTRFVPVGDGVVVGVPNQYFQDWLQKTFGADVRAAAAEVLGAKAVVRFAIDAELFQGKKDEDESRKAEVAEATEEVAPKRKAAKSQTAPEKVPFRKAKPTRRWRSLADFVVGQCNRVAYASAQSVVDEPGAGANPLVLYGPTGTGKTHLLEGVYTGLRRKHPDLRVVFVSAEEFMNRFVTALQRGTLPAFRKQFRECSALLVDNLSFLAGTTKNATKVEFLHTFDALVSDGGQVVVTCDCHPRLAEDLMPELADRLLGGAIWSLLPPDPDARLDLLKARRSRPTYSSSWRATCAATSASWKGRSTACGTTPA